MRWFDQTNKKDFPSSSQMLKYFRDYANHYRLREDIDFNCKVVSVVPLKHNEYKGDCGWRVTLANGEERTYRGVLVCIGHHWFEIDIDSLQRSAVSKTHRFRSGILVYHTTRVKTHGEVRYCTRSNTSLQRSYARRKVSLK